MKKIYFDGGCKPNPGAMEIAVVSEDKTIAIHERLKYGTNNEAEWIAFIIALEMAKEAGLKEVTVLGDSNLVICQAKGEWRVKDPRMAEYHQEFLRLKPFFTNLVLQHVRREGNIAGHYIEEMN